MYNNLNFLDNIELTEKSIVKMSEINTAKICQLGKQVLDIEAQAITNLTNRINSDFANACEYLLNCQGHIVVIGMGKSGHVANKIAATLASTGSPAFFVHPGEASHGDLGMIKKEDVIIAISNSGNTAEILSLLPIIKNFNIPLITLTGNPKSKLAQEATVNIDISVDKEACPLGLAPTSSTTATLAMGDALAIALLETRGFTKEDFALSHPGGMLGKRLLLRIDDLMHQDQALPKVSVDTILKDALFEMTSKGLGMTTIVDDQQQLLGVFTDGDLRRALDKNIDIHTTTIDKVMNKNSKTVSSGTLAIEALELMEQYKITSLIVLNDKQQLVGVIHLHDLLNSGIK